MHADKTNRAMLVLLSLVLVAAGAAGLAASAGLMGSVTKRGALTHNRVGAFIGRNGDWLWPLAAVAALLIVLVALRWLLALLFTTDRAGDLRYRSEGDVHGRTFLSDSALTSAVTEEIRSYRGVHAAQARLIGDDHDPQLAVVVTLEDSADLAGLRHRIETQALCHARQATGKPDLPIRLDLAITTKRASRTT
ncbi:MAG: alkaline shock response membrane anchor protein AmaP [Jatrophihabitans sp.]